MGSDAKDWARFMPLYGSTALTDETRLKLADAFHAYNYLRVGGTENHRTMWMTSANVLPHFLGVGSNRQSREEAIATAKGMSAWFAPTEMEEREGGALHFTMGPEMGSDGQVTAWEPPHRLVYEEDWAALMGKDQCLPKQLASQGDRLVFSNGILILTVVALLGPNLLNIIIVIGLVSWTGTARLVRAEFLTLRESEYVRAAKTLGQSHWKIIFRHILPNAAAPVFVTAVLGIPEAILTEAGLSYLGFGVQPPQATWGNIITDGKVYILDAWWLIIFPGLAIFLTALAFFLAGDALRQSVETRAERK